MKLYLFFYIFLSSRCSLSFPARGGAGGRTLWEVWAFHLGGLLVWGV